MYVLALRGTLRFTFRWSAPLAVHEDEAPVQLNCVKLDAFVSTPQAHCILPPVLSAKPGASPPSARASVMLTLLARRRLSPGANVAPPIVSARASRDRKSVAARIMAS